MKFTSSQNIYFKYQSGQWPKESLTDKQYCNIAMSIYPHHCRLLTSCSFLTIIFISVSLMKYYQMYLGKDVPPVRMGKISFVRGCLSSRRLSLQDSPYICLLFTISICQYVSMSQYGYEPGFHDEHEDRQHVSNLEI